MRLAEAIAKHHVRRSSARDCIAADILSAAFEGLVEAASDFDSTRGVPFKGFARRRITGAVLDYLRTEDHVSRHYRNLQKTADVTLPLPPVSLTRILNEVCARIPDTNAVDPLTAAERAEANRNFEARLSRLPERLRTVLAMRYGDREQTLVKIGEALGLTESRACQLLHEAHRAFQLVG